MREVDVIVPAFNPGRFLSLTLRSLIAQTHTGWRAVVVDDGSDEDLSWVRQLDPRIALVRQTNQGLSAARNRGIAEGTAELVAFLDADDVWLPRKLEAQVAAMRDGVALSSTAFEMVDAGGVRTGPGFGGFAGSHQELLQGNGICVSTAMTRRTCLDQVGGFDRELSQVQDWDLWLRLSTLGDVVKVPDVLAQYRLHGSNMGHNYRRFRDESHRVLGRWTSPADARWAALGHKRVDELAAAQAFDAFRAQRRPAPFLDAIRWGPRYTVSGVASHAKSLVRR